MLDIFQSQRFQSSLKSMAARSGQMARYLKRDANNRRRDYATIDQLNYRLNRVIPIIPGIAPVTGGIFGVAVSGGGFPGFPFGFGPFGGPPAGPGPSGPQGPQDPQGPTGPQSTEITIEESTETETNQTTPIQIPVEPYVPEPTTPGTGKPDEVPEPSQPPVIIPPKPDEDEPDTEEGEEEQKPIPLPDPPPPPIPLTPPFPIPRRKKEEEEEKELVPTAMSLYEFELALRSRRQKEKGADPAWLAPYYQYLGEFFRRNKAARGTREGFLNPGKYPLGGAVELPDGGILTVNPVGNPFDRQPSFRYVNGINRQMGDKNARRAIEVMNAIQAVMNVMGTFAAATAARPGQTRPGQTPTVQDPNYVPPSPTGPLIPPRPPGSVIRPTKPDGGPLGSPTTQPTRLLPPARSGASSQTIEVTPTARQVTRPGEGRGITEIIGSGSRRRIQKTFDAQQKAALKRYDNETLSDMLNTRSVPASMKKMIQEILNSRMEANIVRDPTAVQGPMQPDSNIKTIIQPIVIYKNNGGTT